MSVGEIPTVLFPELRLDAPVKCKLVARRDDGTHESVQVREEIVTRPFIMIKIREYGMLPELCPNGG
jgi:hypothetical protein